MVRTRRNPAPSASPPPASERSLKQDLRNFELEFPEDSEPSVHALNAFAAILQRHHGLKWKTLWCDLGESHRTLVATAEARFGKNATKIAAIETSPWNASLSQLNNLWGFEFVFSRRTVDLLQDLAYRKPTIPFDVCVEAINNVRETRRAGGVARQGVKKQASIRPLDVEKARAALEATERAKATSPTHSPAQIEPASPPSMATVTTDPTPAATPPSKGKRDLEKISPAHSPSSAKRRRAQQIHIIKDIEHRVGNKIDRLFQRDSSVETSAQDDGRKEVGEQGFDSAETGEEEMDMADDNAPGMHWEDGDVSTEVGRHASCGERSEISEDDVGFTVDEYASPSSFLFPKRIQNPFTTAKPSEGPSKPRPQRSEIAHLSKMPTPRTIPSDSAPIGAASRPNSSLPLARRPSTPKGDKVEEESEPQGSRLPGCQPTPEEVKSGADSGPSGFVPPDPPTSTPNRAAVQAGSRLLRPRNPGHSPTPDRARLGIRSPRSLANSFASITGIESDTSQLPDRMPALRRAKSDFVQTSALGPLRPAEPPTSIAPSSRQDHIDTKKSNLPDVSRLADGKWISDNEIWAVLNRVADLGCRFVAISPPRDGDWDKWSRSQTKPLSVNSGDFLLVAPLCRQSHWILPSMDLDTQHIQIFDSLYLQGAPYPTIGHAMLRACGIHTCSQKAFFARDSPQQEGSADCGVFVLAECLYLLARRTVPKAINAKVWRRILQIFLTEEAVDVAAMTPPVPDANEISAVNLIAWYRSAKQALQSMEEHENAAFDGSGVVGQICTMAKLHSKLLDDKETRAQDQVKKRQAIMDQLTDVTVKPNPKDATVVKELRDSIAMEEKKFQAVVEEKARRKEQACQLERVEQAVQQMRLELGQAATRLRTKITSVQSLMEDIGRCVGQED
ncbi:hypothetical protein JOL62DRAFT_391865 [Phyllosticta paracitricarpa]|uniref:Ubiquitin-like protease family profile domain-containing protein n=2 Tax=Phyllosticta TaxID=121621 RepID=A0ABR1LAZ6_9PEZI